MEKVFAEQFGAEFFYYLYVTFDVVKFSLQFV